MILRYKKEEYKIDRNALEQVVKDLESGIEMNLAMLGAIFGEPFWILMVLMLTGPKEFPKEILEKLNK